MPSITPKRRAPATSIATNPARPARKAAAKPVAARRAAPKPAVPAAPAAKLAKPVKPTKASQTIKPPKAPKPSGATKPAKAKQRPVRDSFTMPEPDYDLIDILKARALAFMRPAKKSELLRAGLHALAALPEAQLKTQLDALMPLKPGRPKKAG